MMFARPWWPVFLCGLALGLAPASGWAQKSAKKPSSRQDEKRENEAVKDAQDHLQDARERLKDAEKALSEDQGQLRQAIAAQKAAGAAIEKVQERLESIHGERTGLTAARKTLKETQAEYERAAKPILDRVHAEQKPLVGSIENARAALKPKDDQTDADRAAAVAEHARLTKQLRDIERAALEADPMARPLQKHLDDAETAVQNALKKFESAVERDGELRTARTEFERSKRDVDSAEKALARAQRTLGEARNRVAQATQRLQQKKAADAKDTNKPNHKNKEK